MHERRAPGCGSTLMMAIAFLPLLRVRGGDSGGASVLATAANIAADIVPAGMLPISMAVTLAMQSAPPMVAHPLVVALVAGFACVAQRTLVLIAEAVEQSGVTPPSLAEVWCSSPVLGGPRTVWLLDAAVLMLCSGCCLFYLCFIGDLLSTAAAGMLPASGTKSAAPAQLEQLHSLLRRRSVHIVATASSVLLPLCLLRDLSMLAPFSAVGVLACVFCTGFILWRSLDGSYKRGGRLDRALIEEKAQRPRPAAAADTAASASAEMRRAGLQLLRRVFRRGHASGQPEGPFAGLSAGRALPLINVISVAFVAHYNGAAYYEALQERSVARFATASAVALAGAAIVYSVAGVAGYACFGEAADCVALNNYASRADHVATAARLAMGVSLLASFPLMFAGLRTSALALARAADVGTDTALASPAVHRVVVAVGLGAVTAAAVATPDASLVVGLVGAALGSLFIYTLPPALHLLVGAAPVASVAGAVDVALCVLGLALAVLGTQGALSTMA